MAVSRRFLLRTGAASAVVVAVGGAGWALTRTATQAREPWRQAAAGFGEPRLDLLAYAILAPNPHNLQPWMIRLEDDGSVSVFCQLDRRLPATDPLDRQIVIGFGCFLELLRQAAASRGLRADIDAFPEGEPQPRLDGRPLARVSLVPDSGIAQDPLFDTVLGRRTSRLPFDAARTVGEDALAAVAGATVPGVQAGTTADAQRVTGLRELTSEGWRVEWATPATRRESVEVTRIGKSEINANPDGLFLEGPMMEAIRALGVLDREQMDTPGTRGYQESLEFYERACRSAMAFAWTMTAGNTRALQLEAGRSWVRMQLAANARGISFHPLSQVLQEYPEMAAHYRSAHQLLGARDGEVVQMLARLGYADEVRPAPRWPLESRLISM